MEASAAREIIKSYKLINGRNSKFILKCLFGHATPTKELFELIGKEQFDFIRRNIEKFHLDNDVEKNQRAIRNLPILMEIQKNIPNFRWEIVEFKDKKKRVQRKLKTNLGKVGGIQISLASALFYHKRLDLSLKNKYFGPLKLESFDEKLSRFQELLVNINAVTGDNFDKKILIEWFHRGLRGDQLTILSPVCPDYSHIKMGRGLYRFTFESLGSNVGVTAKKLVEHHKTLKSFFDQFGFDVRYIAAIGDFEALSSENLVRMRLNKTQFIKKLKLSQKQLSKQLHAGYETPLFSEICGGLTKWTENYLECKNMAEAFASKNENMNTLAGIVKSREPLLRNWFGSAMTETEIKKTVIKQGAEYTCMGKIALSKLNNPLILGVDHPKMSSFYQVGQSIPVLYLKTNYTLS